MTLRALIEAVERGEWWGDLPRPQPLHTDLCWKAFNGSLDAAKALHEAVLHERTFVEIHWSKRYDDESRVSLNCGVDGWFSASSTPARAWLLAIMRAVEAETAP